MSAGWIAVDFDGVLAHYDRWTDGSLGAPITAMVARVRQWLAEGRDVRIFTARVAPGPHHSDAHIGWQRREIEAWCQRHLGRQLLVTCVKDQDMIELYDDRAVQVEQNTGRLIGYSTRGTGAVEAEVEALRCRAAVQSVAMIADGRVRCELCGATAYHLDQLVCQYGEAFGGGGPGG